MATEFSRTRARKTISLPGGDAIDIPVIVTVSVIDQNGQETQISVLNTAENQTREVHVDQVKSSRSAGSISVERIDTFQGLDIVDRAQESKYLVDNVTGADATPPHFSTHQKTHVYRYYQNPANPNDLGTWVDSELIDELSVIDQNGQEHIYFLLGNPNPGDLSGQADPGDPYIAGGGGIDPPYRTDPFQNIVDFNSTGGNTSGPPRATFLVQATAAVGFSLYGAGINGPSFSFGPPVCIQGPAFATTIDGVNEAQIDTINSIASSFTGTVTSVFFDTGIDWGVTVTSGSGVTSWHVDVPPSVSGHGQTAPFVSIEKLGPEADFRQNFLLTFQQF